MVPPIQITKLEDFQRLGLARAKLVHRYVNVETYQPTHRYEVDGQLYDVPLEQVIDWTVI